MKPPTIPTATEFYVQADLYSLPVSGGRRVRVTIHAYGGWNANQQRTVPMDYSWSDPWIGAVRKVFAGRAITLEPDYDRPHPANRRYFRVIAS